MISSDRGRARGNSNNNDDNNKHLFYPSYQAKHIVCIFSFKLRAVMWGSYYYPRFTHEETGS